MKPSQSKLTHEPHKPPADAAEEQSPPLPERVRLWPGWISWLIWIAAAGVIYYIRTNRERLEDIKYVDSAAINLLTYLCVIVSVIALWSWFVFRSTHNITARKVAYILAIIFVIFAVLCIRFEGFTGNMIPTGMRFSWQSPRDYNRERPLPTATAATKIAKSIDAKPSEDSPKTTAKTESQDEPKTSDPTRPSTASAIVPTPDDFPQFLGPNRDCYIPNVSLANDWQTKPPHELWRVEVGAGWSAFSVVGNRAVTMEQFGDEELVTCRDFDSGELIWSHVEQARHHETLGGIGPRATPSIHEDRVYSVGATGIVTCLDLRDGKQIWRDDLRERYQVAATRRDLFGNTLVDDEDNVKWGRAGSALIYENLCVVPAGGKSDPAKGITPKSLIAYDKLTGEVKWEGGESQIGYASPMHCKLLGRDHILSVNESNITGHEPATGKVLWSYEWEGKSSADASCSQPHALTDDTVFISKGYSKGAAVFRLLDKPRTIKVNSTDASGQAIEQERAEEYTPELVWDDKRLLKTKFTNVLVLGEYVYGLNDGILECVNWKSGKSQWKKGRYGHGQVLGAGNVILVLGEKSGEVAMVAAEPKAYRELSRFAALNTNTQAWNNLCLVGKKLLVRNADEAACFDLP